uniref:Uncharacterized protein n=1 Tax=Peronospora matthiolae TaxID=2874970 RepID=A0AAV1TI14_9STRA
MDRDKLNLRSRSSRANPASEKKRERTADTKSWKMRDCFGDEDHVNRCGGCETSTVSTPSREALTIWGHIGQTPVGETDDGSMS